MKSQLPRPQLPVSPSSEGACPGSTSGGGALWRCPRCGHYRPEKEFPRNKTRRSGRGSYCKYCAREAKVASRAKRITYYEERDREYARKYSPRRAELKRLRRRSDPDKYRGIDREQYVKNVARRRGSMRKWRSHNKAKIKAYQQSRKPFVREYTRRREKLDPDFKLRRRLRARIYKAVRGGQGSKVSGLENLVGCSVSHLKRHLAAGFSPGMTWANYGDWHIDHIRPCASFDLTDPEQQKQCFHFSNLQPLWALDNRRKSDLYAPSSPPNPTLPEPAGNPSKAFGQP